MYKMKFDNLNDIEKMMSHCIEVV